jgi:hypothetical protein
LVFQEATILLFDPVTSHVTLKLDPRFITPAADPTGFDMTMDEQDVHNDAHYEYDEDTGEYSVKDRTRGKFDMGEIEGYTVEGYEEEVTVQWQSLIDVRKITGQ